VQNGKRVVFAVPVGPVEVTTRKHRARDCLYTQAALPAASKRTR